MKKQTLLSWGRDLTIFALVLIGITAWQSRNLLDDDGSVVIKNQALVNLTGEVGALTEPGKRTLVYFFAPWCNICELSIGNLDALGSDDLNVVRIALDYRSVEDVHAFVERNQVTGTVLLGNDNHKQQFNVPGYPTYYLLDEDNKVVARSFGYSSSVGLKLVDYLNRG